MTRLRWSAKPARRPSARPFWSPCRRQEPCALAGVIVPQGCSPRWLRSGMRAGGAVSRSSRCASRGAWPPRGLLRPAVLLGHGSCLGQLRPARGASERRGRPSAGGSTRQGRAAPGGHRSPSLPGSSVQPSWPQRPRVGWADVEGVGPDASIPASAPALSACPCAYPLAATARLRATPSVSVALSASGRSGSSAVRAVVTAGATRSFGWRSTALGPGSPPSTVGRVGRVRQSGAGRERGGSPRAGRSGPQARARCGRAWRLLICSGRASRRGCWPRASSRAAGSSARTDGALCASLALSACSRVALGPGVGWLVTALR
jgi:hypothetical protein